jgi:hypothetical protein
MLDSAGGNAAANVSMAAGDIKKSSCTSRLVGVARVEAVPMQCWSGPLPTGTWIYSQAQEAGLAIPWAWAPPKSQERARAEKWRPSLKAVSAQTNLNLL